MRLSYIYTMGVSIKCADSTLLITVNYSHERTSMVYSMRELSFVLSSPVLTLLMLIQGQDFVNYIYRTMSNIKYKDGGDEKKKNAISFGGAQTNLRSGK